MAWTPLPLVSFALLLNSTCYKLGPCVLLDTTCCNSFAYCAGILRRVLLLIVIAVVGGTALFFLGLKFAFPEYR